ncbi:uncharacterized protein LOC128956981 [Oppia nitens]|uniref:uncharacterized protein LOC128956981 n=1 Tax=Oppia nitens TaxID=1686743 RepID=UPI0023DA03C2|nr:uncharacterized protein LOC128956981 [Oppia nitens]
MVVLVSTTTVGPTVPVGPPRKQWGGYSAHQNGGGVYQHIDKNGKTYSTYGIPAPPVFTYYDNNRNKVSREHWRQFNSDWPNDEYDDGFTYRDSNDNTIKKHEYNRLKYEWNQQQHRQQRQQRQPNGSGVGVNNNGTTVPVGPPKRSWGSIGVVRLGPVAEFIEDKDGNVRRIPNNKWGEPTYHYYDPKHNEVTKEQWQQFNTDLAENKFKKV